MNQLKYLAYCRKSSEGEDRQAQSIETQKQIVVEYVQKQKLTLVGIIVECKSAKDDGNRPEFQKLIKAIETGQANAILVAHIDRLSRNLIEAGLLDKLITSGKLLEIRTPNNIYTANDDLPLGIELLFATSYSKRLSRRVKEGNETKLRKGEFIGVAPLGYLNHQGKIYPDPQRAKLIQDLFNKASTGEYSLTRLTQYIYSQGLRTRSAGNKVVKAVIHRTLTNPIYYGLIRRKGKSYSGTHEPLVDKSVFDKVQAILKGKRTRGTRQLNFLYRGYLTCSVCGCQYTASLKKERYQYYYCTNGRGDCGQHSTYLDNTQVTDLLSTLFDAFSLPGDLATASLQLYEEDLQRQASNQDYLHAHLTKEIQATEARLTKLEDMLLSDRITKDRYDLRRTGLLNQLTELKEQQKHLPHQNVNTTLEQLEEIKTQAVNLGEVFVNGDDEVRSDLLKAVLWNCELKDGEIVKTRYKKPFAYLEGLSKESDLNVWR